MPELFVLGIYCCPQTETGFRDALKVLPGIERGRAGARDQRRGNVGTEWSLQGEENPQRPRVLRLSDLSCFPCATLKTPVCTFPLLKGGIPRRASGQ